jgi:HPt (histidine-containing phosphotransfer) domain-containing protein
MGDESLRARLLDKFTVQANDLLRQMSETSREDGLAKLKLYSHTLKGSAANMSAAAVGKVANKIESLAKVGNIDDVQGELDRLAAEINRCVKFVKDLTEAPIAIKSPGTDK